MPEQTKQPSRRLVVVLFVIYLVLLMWTILWKLEIPWVGEAALLPRPWKLVPFAASGDAGASIPREILANILLFVPFGVYLGFLAPSWQWWKAGGVFLAASLILEVIQHLLSTGSFDSTDVITNTVGGLAGLGLMFLVRRTLRNRTPVIMTRVLLIATAIFVLAAVIFIASPLHYSAPRDVLVTMIP